MRKPIDFFAKNRWHDHFAWWPVEITNENGVPVLKVWWETVERKWVGHVGGGWYEYRLKPKPVHQEK